MTPDSRRAPTLALLAALAASLAAPAVLAGHGGEHTMPLYGAYDHAPVLFRVHVADALAGGDSGAAADVARVERIVRTAFGAWEDAARAYAAREPSAAHLAEFAIRAARPTEVADVTVTLAATGAVAGMCTPLGAYVGDGNLRRCDAVLPLVYAGWCDGEACPGIPGSGRGAMTAQSYYRLAAHELGHALGLEHTDDGRSIMRTWGLLAKGGAGATDVSTFCFGEIDLAALAHAYGYLAREDDAFRAPSPASVTMPAGDGDDDVCVEPRAEPWALLD